MDNPRLRAYIWHNVAIPFKNPIFGSYALLKQSFLGLLIRTLVFSPKNSQITLSQSRRSSNGSERCRSPIFNVSTALTILIAASSKLALKAYTSAKLYFCTNCSHWEKEYMSLFGCYAVLIIWRISDYIAYLDTGWNRRAVKSLGI